MKRKQLNDKKTKHNTKQIRDEVWEKTGWGKVANWYQNTISSEKSTQKDLILPELLKFLPVESVNGKRILDLGCGTGFFLKEYLQGKAARSLGIDIDKELLELAEENLREEIGQGKVTLMRVDATDLTGIGENSFDIVMSIESIPNIKDFKKFALQVAKVLAPGGKFVAVVNHPAFRVPQSADWYFDKDKQKQGRVVYKYKNSHSIKIDMNPGNKNLKSKIYTYTFHRPFEEYMNTFSKAGLKFSFMKEVCSNRISQFGARKKAEDEARDEIPLFLFLEFTK